MKILIIAGHQNVKYNSIVSLHGNTGTEGELEINIRIADRVSAMLRERGFSVVQSDANANDDKSITSQDFNLALALHCDMDTKGDNGGGMCGSGDSSVDMSWEESLRIKKVFDSVYFPETKIVNKNFVTEGMKKYYMWRYLSNKTPCVLLEMGQAKDPHDSVLLSNTILIASAIVRSICKAFNMPYDLVETPVPNNCLNHIKEINDLKLYQKDLENKITELTRELDISQKSGLDWQNQLKTANKSNQILAKDLAYYKPYKNLYEQALKKTVNKFTKWELFQMLFKNY